MLWRELVKTGMDSCKGFLISVSVLCAVVGSAGGASENGSKENYVNGGRIIGGRDGDHGQLPFMVSIQRLRSGEVWRQHCGGSIISTTSVLTACHCINDYITMKPFILLNPAVLRVVAGVGNVSQSSPNRQNVLAKRLIPHPQCSNAPEAPFFSDSAVLILQEPLAFNAQVQPLKVYSNDLQQATEELQRLQKAGATCLVAGWGKTVVDQKDYRPIMQIAEVSLMTTEKCQTTFCLRGASRYCHRDFSKLKQLCAIGTKNSSFCFADSGGPLVCNGFVFGTVSYGTSKCPVQWPGVYSNVEVILKMINTYGKNSTTSAEYVSGAKCLSRPKKKSLRSG